MKTLFQCGTNLGGRSGGFNLLDFSSLNLLDFISLILAVIALGVTLLLDAKRRRVTLFLDQKRRESDQKRMELERRVQFQDHSRDIRSWGACVIQKMSEAVILCEMNPQKMKGEFYKRRQELRADISSLLDQGRMYFPNIKKNRIGLSKEGAYRGLRQKALDRVAECYRLVSGINYIEQKPNKKLQECMVKKRREFVSELQKALKARQMETITKKLIKD